MSKRTKIILGVVGLLVVGGVAASTFLGAGAQGPEVETATVEEKELAVTVTASGKVEAGVSADVFPPAPGTLDVIYVSDGETVTAGDKLALMDTQALELQVAQAKAGLAAAQSQLKNVAATGGGSAADIKAAQAQVDAAKQALTAARAGSTAAKAAWDNASDAYDAAALMLPSGSPTLTALSAAREQARAGYLQARSGIAQAQAGIEGAKSQLARARAADPASQRSAAQAGVRQAAAAVAAAEDALEKGTLTAPMDGIVLFNKPAAALGGGSAPSEGSAVSPQAAPFTVVDLGALKFIAEVDEADIERVKPGMQVEVTLDSFPGERFASTVSRINPAAQPTATGGTVFQVEILLEGVGRDLLLGMKGDADIEVSSRGSALTIPVEALFSEGGTDYVYAIIDGKLKKTTITVGATTDTEVEVLEGLEQGTEVALSGSIQYTDGMPVRSKR